ncbi:unknown [Prevotella sp. CAG:1058]|nr:unknown [Prevotella sp. CAG:1058]
MNNKIYLAIYIANIKRFHIHIIIFNYSEHRFLFE